MEEAVPAIRVTDPQSKSSKPLTASPPGSPIKNGVLSENSRSDGEHGKVRPFEPSTPADNARRDNSAALAGGPSEHLDDADTVSPTTQSPVDPLSQHILKRTNAPGSAGSMRRRSVGASETLGVGQGSESTSAGKSSSELQSSENRPNVSTKEKKKGVSFFNRLTGKKKKDVPYENTGLEKNILDDRPEGAEAEPFAESVDNIAYNPRYPQPPRYIKVQAQGKKKRDFDRLFLAQELHDPEEHPKLIQKTSTSSSLSRLKRVKTNEETSATWALEFSKDGRYIATGGQDKIVRVWSTLQSSGDRKEHEKQEDAEAKTESHHCHLKAPVFKDKPVRAYHGHTSPVLDLSWSKNNFLLSSSMDKTVRLWHASRVECLCAFKHSDFVTSIQFHPKDDRFFLAGSLDSKIRLWSIPDKSVAFWNQVPEMITAVSFTPDGKTAIAGCLIGLCLFYETEGMKYQTQMHVRSTYGKNAKGSKITGIQTTTLPPNDPGGDVKLLITSNDSRIRLYNYRDKSLEMKFKGNENNSSQIHARFSDDARYIICGSEDKRVFIWSMTGIDHDRKDKKPVEVFEAHSAATTVCAIAPARTRQLLGGSEDPLFDLCNPPPVTLMSKAEVSSMHSGKAPDDTSSIHPPPSATESTFNKPQESPAYIARSIHLNGHIIVTADATGCIKVFRQDCAFEKRMQWDPTHGSRKFSSSQYLRRHSSMASSQRSLTRQNSNSTQAPGERVMSWRQSIQSSTSMDHANGARKSPIRNAMGHYSPKRSNSPKKSSYGGLSHRSSILAGSAVAGSPSGFGSSTPPSVLGSDGQSDVSPANESPRSHKHPNKDRSAMPPPPSPRRPSSQPQPKSSSSQPLPSPQIQVNGSSQPPPQASSQPTSPLKSQSRPKNARNPSTLSDNSTTSNEYFAHHAWLDGLQDQLSNAKNVIAAHLAARQQSHARARQGGDSGRSSLGSSVLAGGGSGSSQRPSFEHERQGLGLGLMPGGFGRSSSSLGLGSGLERRDTAFSVLTDDEVDGEEDGKVPKGGGNGKTKEEKEASPGVMEGKWGGTVREKS